MKRIFLLSLALALGLLGCAAAPAQTPYENEIREPENRPAQTAEPERQGKQPSEEAPSGAEAAPAQAEPVCVPVLEPVLDSQTPMLRSLEADGGYEIDFQPELRSYTLSIPAGRARVPEITAQADEGLKVEIAQPVVPDAEGFGYGYVYVTDAEGACGQYTILVVRDESLGFQLQYLDRYRFCPEAEAGQTLRYVSSAPETASVDEAGEITALALSDAPVTVTALSGGKEVARLEIDRIVPAPLNLFLILGQSNAAGTYDIPSGITETGYTLKQMADVDRPEAGTVFCVDVDYAGQIRKDFYDLSEGRPGFSPALGKRWYALSGEKTLMLQTAMGGSPIEAWEKPENGVRYAYLDARCNLYENTVRAYEHCLELLNAPESGFTLKRIYAYWLQGETAMCNTFQPDKISPGVGDWDFGSTAHIMSAEEYFEIFNRNLENFREDLKLSFMGVLMVRAMKEVCSPESLSVQLLTDLVPARAAQYALGASGNPGLALVSRVSDIARQESWTDRDDPGWGMMGCWNVHYNQTGHNANGVAAAENTFYRFYGGQSRKAESLQLLKQNGRDVFRDGEELVLAGGACYQTAAVVLPLYTDTPAVRYFSDDPSVCTVDRFGMIRVQPEAAGKSAAVTAVCEQAGLSCTITVRVEA